MSVADGTVDPMERDEMVRRAADLGGDHAEDEHHGKKNLRLYSGRDVARALDLPDDLDGETYVALREAYSNGWSSFW